MDSTDKKTQKQDLGHDYRTYTSFYFWIQIFLTGHEGYKHGLWMGTPLSEAYCLLGNILTSVLAGLFRPCNCHSKRFWWNFVSNSPQPLLNWDPLGWCRHLEKKITISLLVNSTTKVNDDLFCVCKDLSELSEYTECLSPIGPTGFLMNRPWAKALSMDSNNSGMLSPNRLSLLDLLAISCFFLFSLNSRETWIFFSSMLKKNKEKL